jgi:hypothetical protein
VAHGRDGSSVPGKEELADGVAKMETKCAVELKQRELKQRSAKKGENMKKSLMVLCVLGIAWLHAVAQQIDYASLTSKYLGQKEPGLKAELFAPGLVSIGEGVHGNIVFTPDFTEAAWHPNYKVDGKALIYIMKYRKGRWESPTEFFPKDGYNYSEPFYSYDGKKLYYLSGNIGTSGNAEKEKIFYVERQAEGWSAPKLLSSELDAYPIHWQFSLDRNENVYFGGKSPDKQGEIYFSQYRDRRYLTPVRLPETINTGSPEFSPFIAPDSSYLVFTRMLVQKSGPPQLNLLVSFRGNSNRWTEAQNLTARIEMPVQPPVMMMGAPRITPDGRYLFFCSFNGKGHMVYWVSARIIEELRPEESK